MPSTASHVVSAFGFTAFTASARRNPVAKPAPSCPCGAATPRARKPRHAARRYRLANHTSSSTAAAVKTAQHDGKAHLPQQALHHMAFADMPNFMRQHACHFVGRLRLVKQPLEQNHLSARQRDRVEHRDIGNFNLQLPGIWIQRGS